MKTPEEENEWFAKWCRDNPVGWIHRKKYPCKFCGSNVAMLAATQWREFRGVQRFGKCEDCKSILVETEHGLSRVRWFNAGSRWDRFKFKCWAKTHPFRYQDILESLRRDGMLKTKAP